MKKTTGIVAGVMLLFLLLAGCRMMADHTSQEAPSQEKAKKYYVAAFDEIEINGVADVVFS